ncbi:MAG TPA: hypothetical protein VGR37_15540 [Longimicrobiaceae bacterium]|nr:hypothetical protein [Longimicrobiaceae bacterium]
MPPYLSEFAELTPEERNLCDQFEVLLDQRIDGKPPLPGRASHWLSVPESLTYEMIQELRSRYLAKGWREVEIVSSAERTYRVALER